MAAAIAVLAMIVFPAADAISNHLSDKVPSVIIVWARFIGSAILITPLYVLHFARHRRHPTGRAFATETLRALIIIAAFGSFILSFRTISFSEAMTYYSLAPIIGALLSVWLLKERLTWVKSCALLLGLVGVIIVLNPSATPQIGAYFAMLTGALYGTYLFLNRVVAIRWNPIQALFLQFLIGSILMLPMVWPHLTQQLTQHLYSLAAIAVISVICNIALINAFRLAEASFLAPFMYVEIPSALIIGAIFFGDQLTWNLLLGAGLIMAAGLLVVLHRPAPIPHMKRD